MCGRYASTTTDRELRSLFDVVESVGPALDPSYNVAPTQDVRVILERAPREDPGGGAGPPAPVVGSVGPGAGVVEGPEDRFADDQRAIGDSDREAQLPGGRRAAATTSGRSRRTDRRTVDRLNSVHAENDYHVPQGDAVATAHVTVTVATTPPAKNPRVPPATATVRSRPTSWRRSRTRPAGLVRLAQEIGGPGGCVLARAVVRWGSRRCGRGFRWPGCRPGSSPACRSRRRSRCCPGPVGGAAGSGPSPR
uniref:Abasic site processing protein n=1 Tax=Rhodococcus hoagii TaxID=43767 RepID=A0A1Z1UXD9_RHOHA|nr:hypothetical protein [Prescottella equi]